ncbi:MAG: hypothetical protein F4024_05185 [Gammaproteobacteria bacterium]|nr:hypothetical protein [Gammaproteobacteria bacterium]
MADVAAVGEDDQRAVAAAAGQVAALDGLRACEYGVEVAEAFVVWHISKAAGRHLVAALLEDAAQRRPLVEVVMCQQEMGHECHERDGSKEGEGRYWR